MTIVDQVERTSEWSERSDERASERVRERSKHGALHNFKGPMRNTLLSCGQTLIGSRTVENKNPSIFESKFAYKIK